MKRGSAIIIVVLLVIVAAVIFFSIKPSSNSDNYMNNGNNQNTNTDNTAPVNNNSGTPNNSNTGNQNPASSPQSYTIDISGFAFKPDALTIKAGDSVTWTNKDSAKHTVTSDSGDELDSILLSKGETYSHTFNTPGEYSYHCTPHPYMKAKIIVQ